MLGSTENLSLVAIPRSDGEIGNWSLFPAYLTFNLEQSHVLLQLLHIIEICIFSSFNCCNLI